MKHLLKIAAAIVTLGIVGCGGTGGTKTSGSPVLTITPRIEAIVTILPTNLLVPAQWTPAQLANPQTPGLQAGLINPTVFGVADPTNIQTGEQYTFQLVYYTGSQPNIVRNIISSGVTWASSDTSQTYGNLAANTGNFIAGQTTTTSPLFVTATYKGTTYTATYAVNIRQARLLGTVVSQGTNLPVPGAQVQFYTNLSGAFQLSDTVTAGYDGSIRASVPTNATLFTIIADTLPSGFYQSFSYTGTEYTAGQVDCLAPLTTNGDLTDATTGLIIGTTSLQAPLLVAPTSAALPAPTGCSDLKVKSTK